MSRAGALLDTILDLFNARRKKETEQQARVVPRMVGGGKGRDEGRSRGRGKAQAQGEDGSAPMLARLFCASANARAGVAPGNDAAYVRGCNAGSLVHRDQTHKHILIKACMYKEGRCIRTLADPELFLSLRRI